MTFVRPILSAVLTLALAAYAVDCSSAATPEQAMQCCKTMQCISHHHHHGQGCCNEMPTTTVDVGQPASFSVSFARVVFGLAEPLIESPSVAVLERLIAHQSHAPPIFSPPSVLPLRI